MLAVASQYERRVWNLKGNATGKRVKCSLVAWVNITSVYDFEIKYLHTVNDSFLGLAQTNVQESIQVMSLEVTV